MKNILLSVFLVATSVVAQDYMIIKQRDGTLLSIPLNDIQKITFKDIKLLNVDDAQKTAGIIRAFALLQNYPNPFNPTTTIEYQLPKNGKVAIRIFDVIGKLIRTLVDEDKNEGVHRIQWDSKNNFGQMVASGMYIYDIRFENTVLSRRMLLIK